MLIFLLLPVISLSQEGRHIRPGAALLSGIIAGESGPGPLLQLAGGITYGRCFTGIGIGYDLYKFNTIPVFAGWQMNFDQDQVFVYAQLGYNIPGKHRPVQEFGKIADELNGGLYMDGGIGYRLQPGKKWNRLLFTAGYSRKYVVQEKTYSYCQPCAEPPFVYTDRYRLGRLLIKAGWEFGR